MNSSLYIDLTNQFFQFVDSLGLSVERWTVVSFVKIDYFIYFFNLYNIYSATPLFSLTKLLLLLSHFSRVRLCATHRRQPTRLPCPGDSPGKNTGVGCHFLLQCMKVKSESEVTQSCPTVRDPMDCSPPGSPVHGIFQARVLEWGAIAFSKVFLQ